MCGYAAAAAAALMVVQTAFSMSANNQEAEQDMSEYKRQAENEIVANELAKSDERRRVNALQEEALSVYGANGLTGRGTTSDHVSNISGELERTAFNMDYQTENTVNSLQSSIRNTRTSAKNRNMASLFELGGKGLSMAGSLGSTPKTTKT